MLHLPRTVSTARIVYGVYRNGMVLDPARAIDWREVKEGKIERNDMGFAIFNIKQSIKDVVAHPDTVMIFEVQVSVMRKKNKAELNPVSRANVGIDEKPTKGYTLYRRWNKDGLRVEEESDEEVEDNSNIFVPFAWSCIELFCPDEEIV